MAGLEALVQGLLQQQARTQAEMKQLQSTMVTLVDEQGESKARTRNTIAMARMQDTIVQDLRRRTHRLEDVRALLVRNYQGGKKQVVSKRAAPSAANTFG